MALKSFRRVVIQPPKAEASAVDVAIDFMDEYADVSRSLQMSFRPITKDEALAIHSAVVARFGGTADGAWDFEPLVEWVQTVAG